MSVEYCDLGTFTNITVKLFSSLPKSIIEHPSPPIMWIAKLIFYIPYFLFYLKPELLLKNQEILHIKHRQKIYFSLLFWVRDWPNISIGRTANMVNEMNLLELFYKWQSLTSCDISKREVFVWDSIFLFCLGEYGSSFFLWWCTTVTRTELLVLHRSSCIEIVHNYHWFWYY